MSMWMRISQRMISPTGRNWRIPPDARTLQLMLSTLMLEGRYEAAHELVVLFVVECWCLCRPTVGACVHL